jgi:hypothetical protein
VDGPKLNNSVMAAEWLKTLRAGVEAQRLVPGAHLVGGSAVSLLAGHRISLDTDHLLGDLRSRFEDVLETLETSGHWTTAKVRPPVMILGAIDGAEVGFRQQIRRGDTETTTVQTLAGPLVLPVPGELLAMKAFLAYKRNVTRDYLDFAVLAEQLGEAETLRRLTLLDAQFGHTQTRSVALEVAKSLASPQPGDFEGTDLHDYKGLVPEWQDWNRVTALCRRAGLALGKHLLDAGGAS